MITQEKGSQRSSPNHKSADQAATDQDLISAFKSGDVRAAKQLVDRHSDYISAVLKKGIRDQSSVPDILQTAFLKFFADPDKFDSTRDFRPWITTVALNVARDSYRKESRRSAIGLTGQGPKNGDEGLELLAIATSLNPSEEAAESDERTVHAMRVQSVLASMRPEYREVLELAARDIPYHVIAEIASIPMGTVKSRIHQARHVFAEKFEAAMNYRKAA